MTDDELREFVRSMIRSVELRIDAMFERHSLSKAALLDSSSQAPTTVQEVDDSTEPVRIAKPSEKALDLVDSGISAGSDLGRSQPISVRPTAKKAARRTPKAEEISVASSDVMDSRSASTKAPRRTSTDEEMLFIPWNDTDTGVVLAIRDLSWAEILSWLGKLRSSAATRVHRPRDFRLVEELERGPDRSTKGRWESWSRRIAKVHRRSMVTARRTEAWSRRIAEIYGSSGVNEYPLLCIHWFVEEIYIYVLMDYFLQI
ncbi:hypothetical protein CsatB_002078 [Cannabis sativa]